MFMRISWGRVNPGMWDEYEAAFKQALEAAGPIEGLKARVISRDLDDPDTGYSVSWWESAEAMEAYENGINVTDIVPKIKPFFAGAFTTNRVQVVYEQEADTAAR